MNRLIIMTAIIALTAGSVGLGPAEDPPDPDARKSE
jgi:hypothetical protein